MRRKPTKIEIADFEKKQEEILSNPNLLSAKKAMEEYHEKISSIVKNLQPAFDKLTELQKILKEATKEKESVYIITRPVEYQILDEVKKIRKQKKYNPNEIVITYNTENLSLDREIDGRTFSCDLSIDGKRKKLIDILVERKTYVETDKLRTYLKCPTNGSVSQLIKNFNDQSICGMRLNEIKIIEHKRPNGYRINPKIIIEKI